MSSANENLNLDGLVNPWRRDQWHRMGTMWTKENDCKLLLFGLERKITKEDYKVIATKFDEKPTPSEIWVRVKLLREQQREVFDAHNAEMARQQEVIDARNAERRATHGK